MQGYNCFDIFRNKPTASDFENYPTAFNRSFQLTESSANCLTNAKFADYAFFNSFMEAFINPSLSFFAPLILAFMSAGIVKYFSDHK